MNRLVRTSQRKWAGVAVVLAALCFPGFARAELVGHWTLENNTTGLQNQGTAGGSQNTLVTGGGSTMPTFFSTGGPAALGGGGYARFNADADGNVSQTRTDGLYVARTHEHNAPPGMNPTNLVENLTDNHHPDPQVFPAFSFAIWFRVVDASPSTSRGTLMAVGHSASTNNRFQASMGYPDGTNTGDLEFGRSASGPGSPNAWNNYFGGGYHQFDAPGTYDFITDGQWHHLAVVVKDPTSVDIYLDGAIEVSSTSLDARSFSPENNYLGIGAYFRQGGPTVIDHWVGDLAGAQLYNHALEASEVSALVPEPNSIVLVGIGMVGLSFLGKRMKRK